MDWSRTKNQIIVILLLLNLALFGLYLKKEADLSPYKNPDQTIAQLKVHLQRKGINLSTEIPKSPVRERPLLVKYQEESPEKINLKYFDGQGDIEVADNIGKINFGQEEITIINNRRFLYENYGSLKDLGENSEARALEILEEKGYDTTDMVLTKTTEEDQTVTFEFTKVYKDKILETSYTRITMDKGNMVRMDRLWIEVIEEEKEKIQIEPAYKALFSLENQDDLLGETIEKIETCYYFNPEEQGLLEDNTKAEQGRAIPAWRISFKSGKTKVLDNF